MRLSKITLFPIPILLNKKYLIKLIYHPSPCFVFLSTKDHVHSFASPFLAQLIHLFLSLALWIIESRPVRTWSDLRIGIRPFPIHFATHDEALKVIIVFPRKVTEKSQNTSQALRYDYHNKMKIQICERLVRPSSTSLVLLMTTLVIGPVIIFLLYYNRKANKLMGLLIERVLCTLLYACFYIKKCFERMEYTEI